MVLQSKLKKGVNYLIRSKDNKDRNMYYGTFNQYETKNGNEFLCAFINILAHETNDEMEMVSVIFYTHKHYAFGDYNFYDHKKVIDGKKAKRNMEKRALDMILKRLVNEDFEW